VLGELIHSLSWLPFNVKWYSWNTQEQGLGATLKVDIKRQN
jgi:hypothetical protein